MMGFMSNCSRFTSWLLTMQNWGLYTAWNGCCPMDSGFSRTSIKSSFSSSFERRFSPIYICKNFCYTVLLVCRLIYIGQGCSRRWNMWSIPWVGVYEPLNQMPSRRPIHPLHPSHSLPKERPEELEPEYGLWYLSFPPVFPKSFFTSSCMAAKAVNIFLP